MFFPIQSPLRVTKCSHHSQGDFRHCTQSTWWQKALHVSCSRLWAAGWPISKSFFKENTFCQSRGNAAAFGPSCKRIFRFMDSVDLWTYPSHVLPGLNQFSALCNPSSLDTSPVSIHWALGGWSLATCDKIKIRDLSLLVLPSLWLAANDFFSASLVYKDLSG